MLFFKCIPLNPFKSFSYLVSLNKYHYHSGLVNVLDMIMALFGRNKKVSWKEITSVELTTQRNGTKRAFLIKKYVYFAVKVHDILI